MSLSDVVARLQDLLFSVSVVPLIYCPVPELSVGPLSLTRPNPNHHLIQPNPSQRKNLDPPTVNPLQLMVHKLRYINAKLC